MRRPSPSYLKSASTFFGLLGASLAGVAIGSLTPFYPHLQAYAAMLMLGSILSYVWSMDLGAKYRHALMEARLQGIGF